MALPGGSLIRFGRRTPAPAGRPDAAEILAAAPAAIVVIDDKGCIARANAAAELLLNHSEGAMIGRPFDDLIRAGDDQGRLTSAPGDAPFAVYDVELTLPGGRRQRADVMVAPLPDHAGFRAVSIHIRTPAHLAGRRSDRASGALSAIGAAAMLAHEIKNPLSGIRGAAQLLEATVDSGAQDLTRLIRDEVDRVAALIDRMESFTDTRPVACTPQNIHAILGHVRDIARQGFARDIPIREVYDPSLPAVLGQRDALIQIMLNLMKNAAEAMKADGAITLTTAYRHGLSVLSPGSEGRQSLPIEVCVIDEGPGAPPEIADHLFEPFVTTKGSGGGLGLALVQKLVSDQGGMVEYAREGTPMRTVLRVLLPRARGAATA